MWDIIIPIVTFILGLLVGVFVLKAMLKKQMSNPGALSKNLDKDQIQQMARSMGMNLSPKQLNQVTRQMEGNKKPKATKKNKTKKKKK